MPEAHQVPDSTPALPAERAVGDRPVILQAKDLLQGRREIWIEHGEEMYRLRLTSAGKLYLSK